MGPKKAACKTFESQAKSIIFENTGANFNDARSVNEYPRLFASVRQTWQQKIKSDTPDELRRWLAEMQEVSRLLEVALRLREEDDDIMITSLQKQIKSLQKQSDGHLFYTNQIGHGLNAVRKAIDEAELYLSPWPSLPLPARNSTDDNCVPSPSEGNDQQSTGHQDRATSGPSLTYAKVMTLNKGNGKRK